MTREIAIYRSKTLKLSNCLLLDLSKKEDFEQLQNFQVLVEQMELHIRQKGAQPIGPLIQRMNVKVAENGEPQMFVTFIRQADTFIHHTDAPYQTESLIRESDCLYTRFVGEEEHMQFAYNKLQVVAYEEEIPLRGDAYTVFVGGNEADGTIVADVFMPKADR
jgi:hypothetical protein